MAFFKATPETRTRWTRRSDAGSVARKLGTDRTRDMARLYATPRVWL